jgi:casein kinase II subunit beta
MSSRAGPSWLDSFLAEPRSALFVRIDDDFLTNNFNSYGIKQNVEHFNEAFKLLRKGERPSRSDADIDPAALSKQAEIVYGSLHARYLLTRAGQQLMLEKWRTNIFEQCPRVYCRNVVCLPYGVSEVLGKHTVKFFCPGCNDIYSATKPEFTDLDGAYFGPNWVHVFLQKNRGLIVPKDPARAYVPKIFGFRIYHSSDTRDDSEYESGSGDG